MAAGGHTSKLANQDSQATALLQRHRPMEQTQRSTTWEVLLPVKRRGPVQQGSPFVRPFSFCLDLDEK